MGTPPGLLTHEILSKNDGICEHGLERLPLTQGESRRFLVMVGMPNEQVNEVENAARGHQGGAVRNPLPPPSRQKKCVS